MVRRGGVFSARALLLLGFAAGDVIAARAQALPAAPAAPSAYASTSGTLAFGFARSAVEASLKPDETLILPRGWVLGGPAKKLVEQVWRASPTFRRQCARLVEGSVEIAVSFDFAGHRVDANAETQITRGHTLRAHIHLRGADMLAAEHLAHEIEHILEQLDDVDLTLAVAERVHGAKRADRPGAFETSRAIAVGEQVAREVRDSYGWR